MAAGIPRLDASRLTVSSDGLQGGDLQGVGGRDLGVSVEAVEQLREELMAQVKGTGLLA